MKTLVTAHLSSHQSAGDVIGSVNAAGVMFGAGSMAQSPLRQSSPPSSPSPPPVELLTSSYLSC